MVPSLKVLDLPVQQFAGSSVGEAVAEGTHNGER
jgi:hypothetical protein